MCNFVIVNLDLETGRRTDLPWIFPSRGEAEEKLYELTLASPCRTYIIKLVPAA